MNGSVRLTQDIKKNRLPVFGNGLVFVLYWIEVNFWLFYLSFYVQIDTTEVYNMQDHNLIPLEETFVPKPAKRKPASQKLPKNQTQENNMQGAHEVTRPTKRNSPQIFQQHENSTTDSLPDSSTSNEYRSLRRKYLLLEEERFSLGRETKDVQDAVKSLEEEKLALLDELVVLEGLVDPSEMDPASR